MRTLLAAVLFVLIAVGSHASDGTPERSQGNSKHMLPKRVAEAGAKKWGLVASYAPYLEAEKSAPVLQSSRKLLEFVRKQDRPVQQNGVWIVTTLRTLTPSQRRGSWKT